MASPLPLVTGALNNVENVRDDACFTKRLPVIVKVQAPGIARPVGEDFEDMARRLVAPDPGVDRHALVVRCAGLADSRVSEHPMAAVQPAIGPPGKSVQRFVRVVPTPTVE